MSTSSLPFFVPDTSAIFAYAPCAACDAGAGWQAAYSPGSDGYDTTLHATTAPAAAVAFNMTASEIEFIVVADACNATYAINGSASASACAGPIADLPRGVHRVVYYPGYSGGDAFEFMGVRGQGSAGVSSPENTTIDASLFTYPAPASGWTFLSSAGASAGASADGANMTVEAEYADLAEFFNATVSVATAAGAAAALDFDGAAIYLYGLSGPGGGTADVYLDGALSAQIDTTNPWRAYGSLLYMNVGLHGSAHNLTVVSTSAGELVLDYALVTRTAAETSSHTAEIVGIVAGVAVLVLALCVGTFVYLVKRRQRALTLRPPSVYPFVGAGAGSGGSTPYLKSADDYYGRQLSASTFGDFETAVAVTVASDNDNDDSHARARSADNVPAHTRRAPPTLRAWTARSAATDTSVVPSSGWLSAAAPSSAALLSSAATSHRPSPLPLPLPPARSRSPASVRSLDSRWTDDGRDTENGNDNDNDNLSPVSLATPGTAVAVHAQNARRSVARMLPASSFGALLGRHPSILTTTAGMATDDTRMVGTAGATKAGTPDGIVTSAVSAGGSTIGSAGAYASSAPPSASSLPYSAKPYAVPFPRGVPSLGFGSGSGFPFLASPPPGQHDAPRSVRAPSLATTAGGFGLRRGVSVKSAKTFRSFFSNLFVDADADAEGVPSPSPWLATAGATATSTQTQAQTMQQGARPDSGIFPPTPARTRSTRSTRSTRRTPTAWARGDVAIELFPESPAALAPTPTLRRDTAWAASRV
ncbi:hypothetical protein Q5752_004958 [Cryptotrichosporon argae]